MAFADGLAVSPGELPLALRLKEELGTQFSGFCVMASLPGNELSTDGDRLWPPLALGAGGGFGTSGIGSGSPPRTRSLSFANSSEASRRFKRWIPDMVFSCDNAMAQQSPEIARFSDEPHLWHVTVIR